MPMPRLARSFTGRWVISSPFSRMRPLLTLYPENPMMVISKVDFPEPLGPNNTVVYPLFTLRDTLCRISLPATSTVRFSISSMGSSPSAIVTHCN